jgi:hypothetical protein
MKTNEYHNDEDANLWACLEAFDFGKRRSKSGLRLALYRDIVNSLGYCSLCKSFVKSKSWCNMLSTPTSGSDRCCDFERVESDGRQAFDVMAEPFVEEQQRMVDAVKLNKYTHWSNKIGPSKMKDSEVYEKPEVDTED